MLSALGLLSEGNSTVVFVGNTTTTYSHMLYKKLRLLLNHFEQVKPIWGTWGQYYSHITSTVFPHLAK